MTRPPLQFGLRTSDACPAVAHSALRASPTKPAAKSGGGSAAAGGISCGGTSGGGGEAAATGDQRWRGITRLPPPSSRSKTGAFRHLLQEDFLKAFRYSSQLSAALCRPARRTVGSPFHKPGEYGTCPPPPSPFRSVFVADVCFLTTAFSAMFVQDVENAAPGDQPARGISRDSGEDAVPGVQRRRGSCGNGGAAAPSTG